MKLLGSWNQQPCPQRALTGNYADGRQAVFPLQETRHIKATCPERMTTGNQSWQNKSTGFRGQRQGGARPMNKPYGTSRSFSNGQTANSQPPSGELRPGNNRPPFGRFGDTSGMTNGQRRPWGSNRGNNPRRPTAGLNEANQDQVQDF